MASTRLFDNTDTRRDLEALKAQSKMHEKTAEARHGLEFFSIFSKPEQPALEIVPTPTRGPSNS